MITRRAFLVAAAALALPGTAAETRPLMVGRFVHSPSTALEVLELLREYNSRDWAMLLPGSVAVEFVEPSALDVVAPWRTVRS